MGRTEDKPLATGTGQETVGSGGGAERTPTGVGWAESAVDVQSWPLSFGQQRLWFLEQVEPDSALYNMPLALRMTGRLDREALAQAFAILMNRHEALRTRFISTGDQPEQIIDEDANLEIEFEDLAERPDAVAEAEGLMKEEARKPFKLGSDRLIRVRLLRLQEEEHLLLVTMHHMVSDEWSWRIFFKELGEVYGGVVEGRRVVLPELPITYKDYAAEQRTRMDGAKLTKHLDYWKKQLSGNPPVLELPTDHPRRPTPTFAGRNQERLLEEDLTRQLKDAARREGATLFMFLLAAVKTLLCRYTGLEDIVVGTPSSGRDEVETEGLVGFFVNTLALRTKLDGNPTFSQLLKRVRETVLGAYAHQGAPLERIVEELQPERTLSHLPFTRVMFLVQNDMAEGLRWPGLELEFVEVDTASAKFDITIGLHWSNRGMIARVEYNTDLFEQTTIERLLGHLEILLKGIVTDPKQKISDLPLMGDEERQLILRQWHDTAASYPRNKCIPEIFAERAVSAPNSPAVTYGRQTLSYGELNERANQLAHYLERTGVKLEEPVGICVERSVDMVVGLLGILKVGGSYVPLDPTYPRERLAFMAKDTGMRILVTQQSLLGQLPTDMAKVICLDGDWELIAREDRTNPSRRGTAEQVAYFMYTSGSTGQPKGVTVPHRAINRLVLNTNYVRFHEGMRIAQVSNISFDASTFEIWGALLNGAQLVGISSDVALSPKEFSNELQERRISAMFLTAALFNQVAAEVPGAFEGVGTVIAGGEALDPKWVRRVLRDRPPGRLLNGYGPTENTTFTCWHLIKEVPEDAGSVPIGRPISNTQVYILDKQMNPVPVGVTGELYTGGDGLARGYWNRAELTSERFVKNPFVEMGGSQLLYRTGDLARFLANGEIECLGRTDEQVKLRGFRIELGEVEVALARHPSVSRCVAKVCGTGAEQKRLVAYVVCNAGKTPNVSEIRAFLKETLPDYMIPTALVVLEDLPLSPNGKVDRRALSAPDGQRPELEKSFVAPRDEVESQLAAIWENALGKNLIGIRDKFFDLGGHSLLAMKVVSQIEKAFGRKLRLATIFQAPTIEELGAILREELKESAVTLNTSVVEIQPKGSRPPLFLIHGAGGGMFWGYVNLSRQLGLEQPVYAFRSRGLDGREEFDRIEDMAAEYVKDLKRVQPRGPYHLGGYCFGGNVAFEMARLLRGQGERVDLLALLNCAPPNSGYTQIRFTPSWCGRFLVNLAYWGRYASQWTKAQRREFFRWKISRVKKFIGMREGAEAIGSDAVDVGDLVDLSNFSAEERKVWESHIRALLNFHPRPYDGPVHLFRSPVHPIWCSFDGDYGWGKLARSGVKVIRVPAAHEKILEEPFVQVVAKELGKLLKEGTKGSELKLIGVQSDVPTQNGKLTGVSETIIPVDGARLANNGRASWERGVEPNKQDKPVALSFAQQRVWVLEQLEPGSEVHNLVRVMRIHGSLDEGKVQKILNELVQRHETFRTSFISEKEKPKQRVRSNARLAMRMEVLSRLRPEEIDAKIRELALEEKRRPFDLSNDVLLRATLIRLGTSDHALIFVAHELAADSGHMPTLFQEFAALYASDDETDTGERIEVKRAYPEFAINQQEKAQAGVWREEIEYWKKQLQSAPALIEMPTDHSRPAIQSYQARVKSRELPIELVQAIQRSAGGSGAEAAKLFLAALVLLLRRHSRQEDVCIGLSTRFGDADDFKGVIGNFGNLIVMRCGIGGEKGLKEFVDEVGEVQARAVSHKSLPFQKLVEELRPPRDQSYHPICQILFDYESDSEAIRLKDLTFTCIDLAEGTTKFDLSFRVKENGKQGFTLKIEYATDLFEAQTVQRMLGHWEVLLGGLAGGTERTVSKLPMLTTEERRVLLEEWTATERDYPKDKSLVELFREQAVRTPEAEAIVSDNNRLTYAQLYSQAELVASRLKKLGVKRGALVGICLERKWEMIASMLGAQMAGAAYVPMDPAYPAERLAFMMEDARSEVVITQRKLMEQLPSTSAHVVCVEELDLQIAGRKPQTTQEFERVLATDLSHVIYTSGSTGKPKGVAIEHRSVVALVCWAREVFTDEELSGVLAATSVCFDLSVFEIFLPLSWGGKIVLAENALALPNLPAAAEVRLINTVPSAIRELLRIKGVPDSVQVVNLAGEPLATALVEQLYEQTEVQKVYDLYGPTETTTYSTYTLRKSGEKATIGKPLTNEQVYLLDEHRQPVPIGVPGELFIGGDGVARGYLHRPELTAERFFPDPFHTGARVYKTGDLAKWKPDGNLEFLGRMDHQVKVRGFRIELGEIEIVLKRQPLVLDAVVTAREDQPGNKRLVAYVAAKPEQKPAVEELKAGLRKKLPEYMTPAVFVFMDALPLTPNGKVDRKALPAPEAQDRASEAGYLAARTNEEKEVTAICNEVLQIKEIGVRDNFFDAGGNSLLAIQVISRIREQFDVELPLSSLFDSPTIETLAAGLSSGKWTQTKAEVSRLQKYTRIGAVPVSYVQERLWFLDQLSPGSHAYNVPTAYRIRGRLSLTALQKALNSIIQRHEALRTSLRYQEGALLQVISPKMELALRIVDVRAEPALERERKAQGIVNKGAQQPFDLGSAPLIRATLVQLADEENILLVVMHHSVSDGWSQGIFFRELEAFYLDELSGGKPANLPELTLQYADFAQWKRGWMQGATLEAEVKFWKETLAGAPPALALPLDHPEPEKPTLKAARSTRQFAPGLSKAIAAFGQRHGATEFTVLMAGLAITLHKWTQQNDLVIGTVVAGRSHREIEPVIGCFMNFLPIRVTMQSEDTGMEIANRTRNAFLEGQSHQDCPFEKIVEGINPERKLNRNPLYNVAFLLQNYRLEFFRDGNIQATEFPVEMEAALLDLRFEAHETEDGICMACEYKSDLFEGAAIQPLLQAYEKTLEMLVSQPEKRLTEFPSVVRDATAIAEKNAEPKEQISITSTFTSEPIVDALRHWLTQLEMPARIEFAPYNQVFQQLLDPSSLLGRNQAGLNVVLLRLDDWQFSHAHEPVSGGRDAGAFVKRNAVEFVQAIQQASARSTVPYLVCICPISPALKSEPGRAGAFAESERYVVGELARLATVHCLASAELERWYPVPDYFDASGDELGHVPYTPVFYSALATAIARKFHRIKRATYKVIVLDCDQTIWSGVCGEDGAKGVRFEEPRLVLQKFMCAQHDAGMLICLCSKNSEADVIEVFAQREEMPLKLEHLAGHRLNWRPKSENLKSLAEELKLGLDSFIFVDDNPVECAEVEANCPGALVLLLPEEPEKIPQFLEHCWAFDHLKLTAEDRKRAQMYRQNQQREELRAQSMNLSDFLAGLDLQIEIETMKPEQLARVSQLTHRTNQFNFTSRRRSESELQKLAGVAEIFTVSVRDRFGNYGLVGAMIWQTGKVAVDIDTFLLSCRVLGRGVEHRMLAHLGEIAREKKLNWVDAHFSITARNQPAIDFLESVGAPFRQPQNGGYLYRFPAGFAAEVAFTGFNEEATSTTNSEGSLISKLKAEKRDDAATGIRKFARFREIAIEANDPIKIHQRIESKPVAKRGEAGGYVAPQTELEHSVCELWQKLLRLDKVGVRDNFFELGGHSLLAVRMFADVEKLTGRKLPLVTIFQSPTVRQLARALTRQDASSAHNLLVPLQPNGTKPPLFLVHGAGGDVLWGYANLAGHLPSDQPIYGIKSQSHSGRDESPSIEEMASCYVGQIRAFQPDGPYYLGGYCFGGNVACEMARQLHEHGQKVALLLLLDSAPANAGYEQLRWWSPSYCVRFIRNASYWLQDFAELKSAERRRFFSRKARALGRKLAHIIHPQKGAEVDLDDVIDPTQFPEAELKLWQSHLSAAQNFVQKPYPGRIHLLRTRGQPLLCSLEEDFCWGKLAGGGVKVHKTSGSHENVFMEPHVRELASVVNTCLDESLNPESSKTNSEIAIK